jgi:hypothetical protein
VVTPGHHPDLDIAGTVSDHFADWQNDIELLAAFSDRAHVAQIAARVACLQINSDARGSRAVGDEPGDDRTDGSVLAPGVRRGVDQVELRMLRSVPGGKSALGFPATVTRPGLTGCLNCRRSPAVSGGHNQVPTVSFEHLDDLANLQRHRPPLVACR